ncbi:hypothetical protein AB3S75_000927 [Citrus x aurantiifolia]
MHFEHYMASYELKDGSTLNRSQSTPSKATPIRFENAAMHLIQKDWEAVDRRTQQRWHNELGKEMSSLNMEPVTIHCDAIVDDDDDNDDNTHVEVDDNEDED